MDFNTIGWFIYKSKYYLHISFITLNLQTNNYFISLDNLFVAEIE